MNCADHTEILEGPSSFKEPRFENMHLGNPTRQDLNKPIHLQNLPCVLKFRLEEQFVQASNMGFCCSHVLQAAFHMTRLIVRPMMPIIHIRKCLNELRHEKTCLRGTDKVRYKPGFTATEDG